MIALTLAEAADLLGVACSDADTLFSGISTDTRSLQRGNLFVALQGPNFDGHDYLEAARERGAAAAVVSRAVDTVLPCLRVDDTRLALGRLAAGWRARFDLPLVAVTGSNGKTTVKEMLAAVLRRCGETLVTRGNLNNDIGLPLTLAGLSEAHRYAVIEMGANHPGEIAALTAIAQPTVALVNNAGPAHLEGFGSLEGVARAKGELFEKLRADGVCIINADDAFAGLWLAMAGERRLIRFGLETDAEVSADWKGDLSGSDVRLRTPAGEVAFRLPLPGRHNIMNALAASAACVALGLSPAQIADGLSGMRAVGGRGQEQRGLHGSRLIDDTYNANPASLAAALEVLAGGQDERWLVLGDMGELGDEAEALHAAMGEQARRAGLTRLFALGPLAAAAARRFGAGGESFADMDALLESLRDVLHGGVTVLVKGSRAMRMERVIEALRARNGEAA